MSLEYFTPFIDVEKALDRLVNDETLFMTVLSMFLEEFKNERRRFSALIDGHRSGEVGELAHYFKGIAANLEISKVCDLIRTIERGSHEEDWSVVATAFDHLCAEVASISSVYEKINQ